MRQTRAGKRPRPPYKTRVRAANLPSGEAVQNEGESACIPA